jgi:hypothetical protein
MSDPRSRTRVGGTGGVFVVKRDRHQRPSCRLDSVFFADAVLVCRATGDHAVCDQRSSAARNASDRFRCSRSARAITAASSSLVSLTGKTCAASAPRAGRPIRVFNSSTSYPASASSTHWSISVSETTLSCIFRSIRTIVLRICVGGQRLSLVNSRSGAQAERPAPHAE